MSPETESKTENQYKPFAFNPTELRNYTAELREEVQHVIGELSRAEANMPSLKVKHEVLKGHPMTLIETLKDVAFFTGQAQKTLSAFLQAPELSDGYSIEKEAQLKGRSFDRKNRTDNRFRTIRYLQNHQEKDI